MLPKLLWITYVPSPVSLYLSHLKQSKQYTIFLMHRFIITYVRIYLVSNLLPELSQNFGKELFSENYLHITPRFNHIL